MTFTDFLHLNDLKLFQNLRETLPKPLNKSCNLLTVKDGVVYTWDFVNNCVLTLNLKAARSRDGYNVTHQNLLPLLPVNFQPEFLLANDTGTLLVIGASNGLLVLELPARYPPHGAFEHNKEVVYCKSHSLDERLYLWNDVVKVRQVKFHPGSLRNNHILVLAADNTLRLYVIENSSAKNLAVFKIGETPMGIFPGTKTSYLDAFGEVGVNFDFGQPEIVDQQTDRLKWPIYVLKGDGSVYSVDISFDNKSKPSMVEIAKNFTNDNNLGEEACSIVCLNTTPDVICVANSNGTIYHSILLPLSGEEIEESEKRSTGNSSRPGKELICFESIELELGLSTSDQDDAYTCPIFLHRDDSKPNRYFASHSTGIHSVNISCAKNLQSFASCDASDADNHVLSDIFAEESKAEYLLCTKTSNSSQVNPVIAFSLYFYPVSLIAILGDGNVVSLGIVSSDSVLLEKMEELKLNTETTSEAAAVSPLKKMLREPFDAVIEKILKSSGGGQPILKLANSNPTQKECYEVLQRASKVFREQMANLTRAREEIEKREKALVLMRRYQEQELEKMEAEKELLQEQLMSFAEKYEDISERQAVIMKRCEKLVVLALQRKSEPSDAEKMFFKQVAAYNEKVDVYKASIKKLKDKVNYQKLKIANWKQQEVKKITCISEAHTETIKTNLKEMSEKIAKMVRGVNEYKERLNLK